MKRQFRIPISHDRTNFKDPKSTESHNEVNVLKCEIRKIPQQNPEGHGSERKNHKIQDTNFMKIIRNAGNVILSISSEA